MLNAGKYLLSYKYIAYWNVSLPVLKKQFYILIQIIITVVVIIFYFPNLMISKFLFWSNPRAASFSE